MALTVKARLIRGFGANAFGNVVTIFIQIVSVPVFLKYWGNVTYGTWLVLTAIPSYLIMSDLGFGSVAANEMTMQVARGDRENALRTFQSTWTLLLAVSALVSVVALGVVSLLPIGRWIHSTTISDVDVGLIVLAFVLQVIFTLQGTLLGAGFRCEGDYALGTIYSNLTRAAEATALIVAVSMGAGPVRAAFVYCAARAVSTLVVGWSLVHRHRWIVYGFTAASTDTVKRLAPPAFAFMAFPLGNAMSLQGFVALIGVLLGPVAVVTFATLRTLSRVGFQLMAMINNAVWPEVSAAIGASNFALTRKLHRAACQLVTWLGLLVVSALWVSGPVVLRAWTHGRVNFDAHLFHGLLLVVVANSFWFTSSVVVLAANMHRRLAAVYLAATTISLLTGLFVLPRFGLDWAPATLLIVDAITLPFVLRQSLITTRDTLGDFLGAVLPPPSVRRLTADIHLLQTR